MELTPIFFYNLSYMTIKSQIQLIIQIFPISLSSINLVSILLT